MTKQNVEPLLYPYGPLMGPYGPIWALMGPYGPSWALMGPPWQVRTFPISDFWSNFARFGYKNDFSTKFINDSASFLPQKLKNHVILSNNPNI